MRKSALLVITALVVLALFDIAGWQRMFEANEMWDWAGSEPGKYHYAYFRVMWGLVAMGVVALFHKPKAAVFFVAAFILAVRMGVEDVLYYWLDGRPLPTELPWLNEHPLILFSPVTSAVILLNVLLWIVMAVILYKLLRR